MIRPFLATLTDNCEAGNLIVNCVPALIDCFCCQKNFINKNLSVEVTRVGLEVKDYNREIPKGRNKLLCDKKASLIVGDSQEGIKKLLNYLGSKFNL